jgi:DNA ligase D-like protein (predicted ligase)/DNA ligase D-like protein (predicted polymerase)/DNA ligase D-like protein (predicted 3'-phosphoesterase)
MARKTRNAFTVPTPEPLPVERDGEYWWMVHGGRRLRFSNLDKVFWPDEGYTKGDLVAYYYNVADVILPYLAGRPLTMKRMPDGITGPFFYEKATPSHTPDWMPRCPVYSEEEPGKVNHMLMAQDVASLLFVVNLGCVQFDPLHMSCGSDEPDYLFFDLDPFEPATFDDVLAVALHVRAALGAFGITAYPKTSGATGMQIYVGVAPGHTFEQTREFVGAISRAIHRTDPERTTMEWEVSRRAGKVFLDHNMNRRAANIASAWSVRPEPGATVSAPLRWEEVEAGVHPSDFTIGNIHERIASMDDPCRAMLSQGVDLRPALEALGIAIAQRPRRKLEEYERKRKFDVTPEPGPSEAAGTGNSFVIQKHNATRLHYDLRLERDGVMVSWAVPRGLPTEHGDRRLAVHTEDHPIEYSSFQGRIPEGEYGGGEVKIFDRGTYDVVEWTDDKVSFRLRGERLQGEYHLVKTAQGWLVLLAKGSGEPLGARPPEMVPMLAEGGHGPFEGKGWRFEPKLDGVRTLAYVDTGGTRLVSRTGRDQTAQYPELSNLAMYVNALTAVVDGEIVAVDEAGRPSFNRLQQRMNLGGAREIDRARRTIPATLYAFDLLWMDGEDLTRTPLQDRRERLESIVTQDGPMKLTVYTDGDGLRFYEAAKQLGIEGVIGKKLGSVYQPGRRSKDWRKVKIMNRQDCVILGWTRGSGSRSASFGALLVGAYRGGELVCIGQVGTGFDQKTLDDLLARLAQIEADAPALPELKQEKGARFVRPELVCEVEYLEITPGGKLRAPSYKGLRPDKAPEDCVLGE